MWETGGVERCGGGGGGQEITRVGVELLSSGLSERLSERQWSRGRYNMDKCVSFFLICHEDEIVCLPQSAPKLSSTCPHSSRR